VNKTVSNANSEIVAAFNDYEAQQRIGNTKVGCALVVTLMPLGSTMDYFFYHAPPHDHLWPFFYMRLACSSIAALIWALLYTRAGRQHGQWLGLVVPLLPVVFLAWMIAVTNGFGSTYYAALNLVLLAVGAVLHWTLRESIVAVLLALGLYIGAGVWAGVFHEPFPKPEIIINNFYFIALMDIIVVVGTYFQSRARFREFVLRQELDKNRKALEASLIQLKENEAQLVQSEKLASLGRMSAGMIHEINNPLNFATTGLFTLRKKGKYLAPEQQEDYADILKDVEEGVNRVKTIVSDLRMFTHPDTEQRDDVAVSEVVTAALRFLNNEFKVQFDLAVPANLTIWANKNKLIHVLTNLLQNSLDALKTKTFTEEKPTVRIAGRMENGVSFLTVHDNGPGIAAEHLDKIYDPFFTTKDVGEGMGLGLSICYRIVREAKGKISVKTEPGKYCEFTLEFPATAANPATT